jgi:hypothetical protein
MSRRALALVSLLLAAHFAAAAPAWSADVTAVSLDATIALSSLVSDEIAMQLRVTGTGLSNGTLTRPITGSTPITLQKDGADLVLDDDFASESELNAFLPSGNYVLSINNGTVLATLVYTRPLVPSPAISAPAAGSTVPPGPIELLFAACTVCNLSGDSVEAALEDDMGATLDEENLTSTRTTWIPQDSAGALVLPEQSDFVARVTHTAVREANTSVTDDNNVLVFTHRFVRSDEVDFKTGFARPEGHFCLAVNFPSPPTGCEVLTDPLLQVLDTSGVFSTQVAGHDVTTTISVAPSGVLTGSATADLDDDGSPETSSTRFKGRLSGKRGELRSRLAYALNNTALDAKLRLTLRELLSIPGNTLSGTQRASGSIGGTKIKETTPSSSALPFAPLGWLLELDVDELTPVQNALLILEGGRSFALTGTHEFKFTSGRSTLRLRSTTKGIRIAVKKVVLDDATNPLGVTGGSVSPSILGQGGRATLP